MPSIPKPGQPMVPGIPGRPGVPNLVSKQLGNPTPTFQFKGKFSKK